MSPCVSLDVSGTLSVYLNWAKFVKNKIYADVILPCVQACTTTAVPNYPLHDLPVWVDGLSTLSLNPL